MCHRKAAKDLIAPSLNEPPSWLAQTKMLCGSPWVNVMYYFIYDYVICPQHSISLYLTLYPCLSLWSLCIPVKLSRMNYFIALSTFGGQYWKFPIHSFICRFPDWATCGMKWMWLVLGLCCFVYFWMSFFNDVGLEGKGWWCSVVNSGSWSVPSLQRNLQIWGARPPTLCVCLHKYIHHAGLISQFLLWERYSEISPK